MAFLHLLLVICALIPSIFGQCTLSTAAVQLKRPVFHFSIELSTRLAQDKENHFISSPLSMWLLISTLSNGATDETLAEIQNILKLHPHKCFNKKYWEILKTIFQTQDVSVKHSSMIVIDESLPLKDAFLLNVQDAGLCEIALQNFAESTETTMKINDYVSANTNGIIEDIVTPNDFNELNIILLDALYFKGMWTKQFSAAYTDIASFHDEVGNPIGNVSLMYINSKFYHTTIEQIQANVVELPYGRNNEFSLLIFLPSGDNRLASVIYNLKTISLATVFKKFEREGLKSLTVQIPRLKITSDLDNLKELLSDMGLTSIFDERAKFLDITDDILYVTSVLQKASVEITEEGTEAAAVSEMELGWRSLGNEFIANRPFYFMIVNKEKQVPLFTGAYSKPSIY